LAAARVRALSVDQLLGRLGDRFRLLTGGSRTALARHQTLRATVDWSHALLTGPERVLFRRLAVFAGGWTLEAAEAVGPDPAGGPGGDPARDDVLDLLTRLVDKSLVLAEAPAAGPARYRLLETLRQYAQHKLAEAAEGAAVRGRHAAHYLALAERAAPALYGPQQLAWLDRLEEEHANVREALAWLTERGAQGEPQAAEAALRLGAALTQFWVIRSHLAPTWGWLGRLLALPGARRTAARARALAGAAWVAYWRLDRPAAQRLAAEGLAVAQQVGDGESIALAHLVLGLVAMTARDAATACPHLEASRHAFAALGYASMAAGSVLALGMAALSAGDDRGAARRYAEAEALARPTGDGWVLGLILEPRAELALHAGEYRLARRLLEEALALRRAHRAPHGIGQALSRLGRLALVEGDAAAARRRLTQGLAVWRDAGCVWRIPVLLRNLARVAEAQGQPARAARLWSAAAAQHQALLGRPLPADEGPTIAPTDEGPTLAEATESLRARVGAVAFDAAWAAGQAMTLEQAVADALEDTPDAT
jgi:non-specific serine/threonine protein kinase